MKKLFRAVVNGYMLMKVAPVIIGGAIILIETSMNGMDNTIDLLRQNRLSKDEKA